MAQKDQSTIDPMNLSQWEFYIIPTSVLDTQIPSQKTITLPSLIKIGAFQVKFDEIAGTLQNLTLKL